MYVPLMTLNNPSYYGANLKTWENMYNQRDFYIKLQNWDVCIRCMGGYAVVG